MSLPRHVTPTCCSTFHQSTEASGVDGGILSFGTSVSVNDDLRRSIELEISDIDSSAKKIMEEVNVEKEVERELRKGFEHATKETRSIVEQVSQHMESLEVNQHLLKDLKTTFDLEIMSTDDIDMNKRCQTQGIDRKVVDCESSPTFSVDGSLVCIKKNSIKIDNAIQDYKQKVQQHSASIRTLAEKKQQVLDDTIEQRRRLEAENLSSRQEQLITQTGKAHEEFESETMRAASLKAELQKSEERQQVLEKESARLV